jgi:non-ribosomal peptide synthetase component E (peptide arylation enzyme)
MPRGILALEIKDADSGSALLLFCPRRHTSQWIYCVLRSRELCSWNEDIIFFHCMSQIKKI